MTILTKLQYYISGFWSKNINKKTQLRSAKKNASEALRVFKKNKNSIRRFSKELVDIRSTINGEMRKIRIVESTIQNDLSGLKAQTFKNLEADVQLKKTSLLNTVQKARNELDHKIVLAETELDNTLNELKKSSEFALNSMESKYKRLQNSILSDRRQIELYLNLSENLISSEQGAMGGLQHLLEEASIGKDRFGINFEYIPPEFDKIKVNYKIGKIGAEPSNYEKLLRKISKKFSLNSSIHFNQIDRVRKLQTSYADMKERYQKMSGFYRASQNAYYLHRQATFARHVERIGDEIKADCYICLLPDTLEAGFQLKREYGGTVICDNVENIRADQHTAAPNYHSSVVNLAINASIGSMYQADKLLTVGKEIEKLLKRFNKPTMVMENFRNYQKITAGDKLRAELGLSKDDVLLFTCGSVIQGMEYIIEALSKLPNNFHLVGFSRFIYAEYEDQINSLVKKLKLSKRVHFKGFVPYNELAILAAECDIGLISNDTSNPNAAVGYPNRFFDFLAANLPVVSTAMPDVVARIEEFNIGAVVKPNSAAGWKKALETTYSNIEEHRVNVQTAKEIMCWENREEEWYEFLGSPKSVTFVGYRNLSTYRRFIRMGETLIKKGCRVNYYFPAKSINHDELVKGATYYYISDLYSDDAIINKVVQ